MIEEQIKELDALINLYKDDPNDGLRNKIWVWYTNKLTQVQEEAVLENLAQMNIYAMHKEKVYGKNREYFLTVEEMHELTRQYLSQQREKGTK